MSKYLVIVLGLNFYSLEANSLDENVGSLLFIKINPLFIFLVLRSPQF